MKALWLGRFQPPTVAHYSSLLEILERYAHVRIGVVYNSPRPHNIDPQWESVLDAEDADAYQPARNPYQAAEVVAMWDAVIRSAGLNYRVECVSIKRPQFFDFNEKFPPDEYALVSTGEGQRSTLHRELFNRSVDHFVPAFILHNSRIKELVKAGESWQWYIAPGAWEVFQAYA